MKYKEMSPWKDAELWDDNRPRWEQRIRDVYMLLPRELSVRIVGLAQAYGRPLVNRFKGSG